MNGWNGARAEAELLRLAADHIEDGTFAVCGWELADIAQSFDVDESRFRAALREHLEWDEDAIDAAVERVRTPHRRCETCSGRGEVPRLRAVT